MRIDVHQVVSWVREAFAAARTVPAIGLEADAWVSRGICEVAAGALLLDEPAALAAFDDLVRQAGLVAVEPFATRLSRLRRTAGPVPSFYPATGEQPPASHGAEPEVHRAACLLLTFCEDSSDQLGRPVSSPTAGRLTSVAEDLRWGARFRPSADETTGPVVLPSRLGRQLARRAWYRLPGATGPVNVVADLGAHAHPATQRIWRGVHDGSHLDHLETLARQGDRAPAAIEYGAGLQVTEAYAMAVELLATAECLAAGELDTARTLRTGLIERIGRTPGISSILLASGARSSTHEELAAVKVSEFALLPALAGAYLTGPLRILGGAALGPALPDDLTGPLLQRWQAVCARVRAAELLARQL
ncbi:hypothetical protein [Flindersiella endophytica]